jgi:hypothetical protein
MFYHSFEIVQDFLHLGGNMCSLLRVCRNFYMMAWLRHTVAELVEDYDAGKRVEYDTLIFLALHCWHPCRDLRCVRRPLMGNALAILPLLSCYNNR